MVTILLYILYLSPIVILLFKWDESNFLPILISILIVLVSINGIIKKGSNTISFYKIFCVFNYFFLGIVPTITYIYNINFWGAGPFTADDYIVTNLVVIISIIIFNISYNIFNINHNKFTDTNKIFKSLPEYSINKFTEVLLIFISLSICLYIYYINGFDIINVFTRGKLGDRTNILELSQIQYLVITFFLVPILSINLLLYGFSKKRSYLVIFVLACILIMTAPPTSMPRILAASMYLPLLLLYFPFFSQKHIFPLVLVSCLIFIFPFLDIFRYEFSELSFSTLSNMFINLITSGHVDSYQSLMVIIKDETITYGRQSLGVILFFIPREFWEDKPIGSGQMIADKLNFEFNNISANFFAEGFINFGFFGVLIFVISLAMFCGRLDFKMQRLRSNHTPRFFAIYLVLLPQIFFMLRGDLMSSFSFIIGIILSVILMDKIINFFN